MPSRRSVLTTLSSAVFAGCASEQTSPTSTETATPTTTPASTASTGTATPATTPPADLTGAWTHPDADPRGTRSVSTRAPDSTPERVWSAELGQGATPVLFSNGAVYTAIAGQLTKRDARTGKVTWRTTFGEIDLVAVSEDTLYVTTGKNTPTTRALSTAGPGEGFERWRAEGVRVHRATSDLIVTTASKTLRAYAPDGTERWRVHVDHLEGPAERFGSIAVGPDHVFTTVESGGSVGWVYGFDRATGEPQWHDIGPNHAGLLTVTPDLVLSGGFHGQIQAWGHDGSSRWKVGTTPPVGDIAFASDRVYVSANTRGSTSDPALAVLDTTGSQVWTRKQGKFTALADDVVLVDTSDGLSALDSQSGNERWTWSHTDAIGRVVPATGALFLQTGKEGTEKKLHMLV
ncbi:PQQ-binding-like beta-propeller repeat protein [Halobaculum sp. WSA2]|uniref:PQQ-binding-like beta-propeller repeat protein n=1 Tax=Halobaculum saliterrae TaxID=2073113 RepID=A0A6B0SNW3_9EURY|nr:PQQ-binding-like beta-propeller repeat protein [Halobaculum saliterrae]MXR40415.1 PQQ-binding-like beta-propeller repeat protein [Halobaculum saliterrae]